MLITDDVDQKSESLIMRDDDSAHDITIPSFFLRKSAYDDLKRGVTLGIDTVIEQSEKPTLHLWLGYANSLTKPMIDSLEEELPPDVA